MDTHLDHHDLSIRQFDEPRVPEALLCPTQLTAMDFLERCVRDFEPLAALAGDAGTGKTTALDAALARRDRAGDRIIRARNFPAGPLSLHRALTAALGVADAAALSAEQLEPALRRALADSGEETPPVLAVDNAHALPPETLRYLSLLAGLRESGRPLFRILLVGRPGFTTPQATPVQLTLEPIHPAAAREVIEQRLAAADITLEDGAVQAVVRDARGNLGRLDALLRARIEQAQRQAWRGWRLPSLAMEVSGAAQRLLAGGQPRWQDTLGAAAVLLAVSIATAVIGYHTGAPHQSRKHIATASAEAARPTPVSLTTDKPPTQPATPLQSPPAMTAAPAPTAIAPKPLSSAPLALPAPPLPAPVASPAQTAEIAAPTPLATEAAPKPVQPLLAPTPDTKAPVAPTDTMQPVAVSPALRPTPARFRVNNVSSCHHGVCPRWSVTDIDRHAHYFAAFDPTPLHLDHDTLQRLRQGGLELTITGTVKKRGTDGQTLVADALQSMAPHHGRRPSSGDPDVTSDRSPPQGFLLAPGDARTADPPADPQQ